MCTCTLVFVKSPVHSLPALSSASPSVERFEDVSSVKTGLLVGLRVVLG